MIEAESTGIQVFALPSHVNEKKQTSFLEQCAI